MRLGGPDARTAATLFVLAWASTLLIQIVAAHLSWFYDAAENLRAYLQVTGLAGFGTVGALAFSVRRRRG